MYAFAVGYPIGAEGTEYTFLIEVNGKFISLNKEEAADWNGIFFYSDGDIKKTIYTELSKKGVCVFAENAPSLLSHLMNFKPIRQGSSVRFEGNMVLLIADRRAPVDKLQLEVWRLSNGQRTVKDIYKTIKKMDILNSENPEHHFGECMAMLTSGSAVFLI